MYGSAFGADAGAGAIPGGLEQREGAPLSVSAAMALAKGSLESIEVRILGEVSEVAVKPGYKAAYFTVKDASASLPCMMWNNRYRSCGVQLALGQLVELAGRFTLYAPKGRMNFDVSSLALAGEGDLRLKVANLARKLEAEGLTSPARKRALPPYPERIGLVTSPRSAAVHDVLRTLRRRFPHARVLLAGVPVEGSAAAAGMVEGLRCVCEAGAQVVLLVRGGGSFEDMMPFNDEALARAIAACPVPLVTGIGHEVDTSIADMVADLRASTPTAAAEAVSPSAEALASMLAAQRAGLASSCTRRIDALTAEVARVAARPQFADPLTLFAAEAQALDFASERLARAPGAALARQRERLASSASRLLAQGPRAFDAQRAALSTAASRLEDLSPLGTVARGYAIARTPAGGVVRSVAQAPAGSNLLVTVADGELACTVMSTAPAAAAPSGAAQAGSASAAMGPSSAAAQTAAGPSASPAAS